MEPDDAAALRQAHEQLRVLARDVNEMYQAERTGTVHACLALEGGGVSDG